MEIPSETAIQECLGFSTWLPGFNPLTVVMTSQDLGSQSQFSGCPDVLKLDEGNSRFASPCLNIWISSTLLVNCAAQKGERLFFFQRALIQGDCVDALGDDFKIFGFVLVDDESNQC